MAIIKCKMCGADLVLTPDSTIAECEYCETVQTVPSADSEKKLTLFARANRLRMACEFDKAAGVYEAIVADFLEEAEAYWGLVLCKYGIEYVDDPGTGKKVPTCHRSSFDSVMDDVNFDLALENADAVARKVYRDEAKQIEEIRKGIIAVSSKEDPYDIFICYKETDINGDRTLDSVLAQDIYNALTEKGYRVFFSRITLEDKLGQEYEPYIFAALNSAKVMLAVGTDYEHYNAVWVKNEWSRFLHMISAGQKKTLIPCYKNIDAYDMPKEFAKLQAQDLGKIGAMQDLLRGVGKILPKEIPNNWDSTHQSISNGVESYVALLQRGQMALEDGEWVKADSFFERVLNQNAECAQAYIGKLMAKLKVSKQSDLKNCARPFDKEDNYIKALRFADDALIATLKSYIVFINERNEGERIDSIYSSAVDAMLSANTYESYTNAAKLFKSISGYLDADKLARECADSAEEARKDAIYIRAKSIMKTAMSEAEFQNAANLFKTISGYRDSDDQARYADSAWQESVQKAEELYLQYYAYINGSNPIEAIEQEIVKLQEQRANLAKAKTDEPALRENLERDTIKLHELERQKHVLEEKIADLTAKKANLGFWGGKEKKTVIATLKACQAEATQVNTEYQQLNNQIASIKRQLLQIPSEQEFTKKVNQIDTLLHAKQNILMNISSSKSSPGLVKAQIADKRYLSIITKNTSRLVELIKDPVIAQEVAKDLSLVKILAQNPANFSKLPIGAFINAGCSSVYFGSYQQNGNYKEPIEWYVLKKRNGKALLLSKYVLDCKEYESNSNAATWASCSLRRWLNESFYGYAFSSREQAQIITDFVSGNNQKRPNRVKLLNSYEFELITREQRKAKATSYAKQRGVKVAGNGFCEKWWLSEVDYTEYAPYGNDYGTGGGYIVGGTGVGVRPAIWIKT